MTIDIVFCLDRNVIRPMIAAMNSIVQNTANPEDLRFNIAVPMVDEDAAEIQSALKHAFPDPKFVWRTSSAAAPDWVAEYVRGRAKGPLDDLQLNRLAMKYARLYMPELFPDIGKIIYFDCDIIVLDDVAKLWDEAEVTRGAPFAAAPQLFTGILYFQRPIVGFREGISIPRPFNSGMFVTDVRDWETGPITRIRHYLDWNASYDFSLFALQDEPILNLAFKDYLRVSARWNRCGYGNHPIVASILKRPLKDMAVIHWSGGHRKPWKDRSIAYADQWWAYDIGPVPT